MLVVEGLTCRFGTKTAVDNASFSVAPGSFIGVIGVPARAVDPARMINRLAEPTSRGIFYDRVMSRRSAATCGIGAPVRPWCSSNST